MSTVMTSQDGKRRCDATCHGAAHPKCNCICGGKFHGANVRRDMEGERKDIQEILFWKAAKTYSADKVEERCAAQPGLFEEENACNQEV